ncbi:hypothetical protein NDU88_007305 [Pleurodeles waltl]|uniref:Uncharacterized protein n=1 Tax=Pleurodeles waltl TaxID=8319 RepID=A0AAV7VU17_PLEWA|nr:hypothetical protein NDU88_007305 [Pleurodeles waltl]
MTPDFRVPGAEKRENGRERASEEPDAADHNTEEPTESGDREEPEKRPGTTGVSRAQSTRRTRNGVRRR